jgi:membrane protein DedA with SNARE-associated domain
LSAVLSHKGVMWWPFAFAACFVGVLVGDFLVYYLGYFYGEKVLSLRLTRSFLTRSREAQIKGDFHRHGIKILIVGRFAVGFRTAAYLTAGILRLPALRLLGADMIAATLSTTLMFAGGYWFADWIEKGIKEAQHFIVITLVASVAGVILYRYIKARRRAGLRVGPPVLVSPDDLPLPPDDLSPSTIQRNRPRERGASGGSSSTIVPAPAVASVPSPPSPSGATVETNGVAAMGPGSGSGSATPSPRASTTAGP